MDTCSKGSCRKPVVDSERCAFHSQQASRKREYLRAYRRENKERLSEKKRESYLLNRDAVCEKQREYRKQNPEKARLRVQREGGADSCIVGVCDQPAIDGKRCALHERRYRYCKTHNAKDPEKRRVIERTWRSQNPEKVAEWNRKQYLRKTPERIAYAKTYRSEHPEKRKGEADRRLVKHGKFRLGLLARISNANQRARKLGREGRITEKQILALYESQEHKCFDCGKERSLGIGHLVPLFHRFSTNDITNIVLQCHSCNSRQSARIHPSVEESYWLRVREHLNDSS